MQSTKSSKATRRQIADEFKERKVPKGIFAVRCSVTFEAWVGSSPNLNAAQNSLWFQLRAGRHRNASLQETWKLHGEEAFSLEVLERFEDDTPELLLNDMYALNKKKWGAAIAAHAL
jgi:hypothetical protein